MTSVNVWFGINVNTHTCSRKHTYVNIYQYPSEVTWKKTYGWDHILMKKGDSEGEIYILK